MGTEEPHTRNRSAMMKATKLNQAEFYFNPEHIDFIESSPDTIITFENGKKVMVKETPDEIIEKFLQYQRWVRQPFIDKNDTDLSES